MHIFLFHIHCSLHHPLALCMFLCKMVVEPLGVGYSICKKIFIFNWRLIALQYCVCFCHTSTRMGVVLWRGYSFQQQQLCLNNSKIKLRFTLGSTSCPSLSVGCKRISKTYGHFIHFMAQSVSTHQDLGPNPFMKSDELYFEGIESKSIFTQNFGLRGRKFYFRRILSSTKLFTGRCFSDSFLITLGYYLVFKKPSWHTKCSGIQVGETLKSLSGADSARSPTCQHRCPVPSSALPPSFLPSMSLQFRPSFTECAGFPWWSSG